MHIHLSAADMHACRLQAWVWRGHGHLALSDTIEGAESGKQGKPALVERK
jgi:hypothetical protein